VYAWFYFVFRLSYGAAILGYVLVLIDLFTNSFGLLRGELAIFGGLLIFYGLYFGVLGKRNFSLLLICFI